MRILVVDIGGRNVKIWTAPATEKVKFPSGKELTPTRMLDEFRRSFGDEPFDRVSIGYPGQIEQGRIIAEPYNLGDGWVDFDFEREFGCPVRLMNDACMQALGAFEGGRMLYLGLGTSAGTALVYERTVIALALGHLLLDKTVSFEDALSRKGLQTRGEKQWARDVINAARILKAAFLVDYLTLGGGNAKKVTDLPPGCRRGGNFHAYIGGLRMWEDGGFWESQLRQGAPSTPVKRNANSERFSAAT
jgi:polyphosphate glucokinase